MSVLEYLTDYFSENPIEVVASLILIAVFLVYIKQLFATSVDEVEKILPIPMQDMTVSDLLNYDGVKNPQILFALNKTIYDVTRGKSFYGPGGPYGALAGHDATRALATMDLKLVKTEWDDHEGLTAAEVEVAVDWENSFKFKYLTVGRLVQDDDQKHNYGDRISFIRGAESLDNIIG